MKKILILLIACLVLTACTGQKTLVYDQQYFEKDKLETMEGPIFSFSKDGKAYFLGSIAHSYMHEMTYKTEGNKVILYGENAEIAELEIISADEFKIEKFIGDEYLNKLELETKTFQVKSNNK